MQRRARARLFVGPPCRLGGRWRTSRGVGRNIDWAELRRHLNGALGRICPSWLAERREDLVQAALVKVMEIEQRREGETEWTSFYLARVAHSALVDEIRRRRRRPEDPLEERVAETTPEEGAADPERGTLGRELGRGLRACLAGAGRSAAAGLRPFIFWAMARSRWPACSAGKPRRRKTPSTAVWPI